MYKIIYTKESEDNMSDIFDYISNNNDFYAAKVLQSIKSTIDILKLFPLSGAIINSNIRIIVDSKYRYSIYYSFNGKEVVILYLGKYKKFI
ncbi:MAG: type II toxin-antitoxin system RelE/ParE family toxin [Candidatus Gracilibacteria bacterium]|nr:type II toxin-antitoxin system RelE/ParE family toxin [Candidatus Gracilibacteria bacterium]